MLSNARILIVEDDAMIGMDLEDAVAEAHGQVVGPVASVKAAMALLDIATIEGAILDANVLDGPITPLALRLQQAGIPMIVHTGVGITDELRRLCPALQVFMKPTPPAKLVLALSQLMRGLPRPPSQGGQRRPVGAELPGVPSRTRGSSDGSEGRKREQSSRGFGTALRA